MTTFIVWLVSVIVAFIAGWFCKSKYGDDVKKAADEIL